MPAIYIMLLIFGYLCGSIPFGKIIGLRRGIDIQRRGSGNIGFANARRILGWRDGLLTLLCDVAKGIVPTWITLLTLGDGTAFWVGVASIVGHVFPVWLGFKGGKGIATGLGVLLVISPLAALTGAGVYIVSGSIIRSSSTASLIGIIATVLVGTILTPPIWWQLLILLCIALWTLRQNLLGTVPNYDI